MYLHMRVRIAKLGQPVQTVELADGATVSSALKEGGFDLDTIKSVKKNSSPVEMGAVLSEGDTLLVSSDKIKGGLIKKVVKKTVPMAPEADEAGVIMLNLDVEEVTVKGEGEGLIAYDAEMTTRQIVREYLQNHGHSMNDFVAIVDEDGEEVASFEDGGTYTIQVEA